MKQNSLQRGAIISAHLAVTAILCAAFGPVALLLGLLNPSSFGPVLGAFYTKVNATMKGDLTAQNSKVQEELWVRGILGDSSTMFQTNPFMDNMMGGLGSNKAVIQVKDTQKVQGNTINIPTRAGLAGPGVAGEGDRIGSEQKFRIGSFPVQIGRYWFGYGYTGVALDETVIGSYQDQLAAMDLREQVAKKKSDDILMKIRQRAGTSGRNYTLPDGVATRANLTAANTFSTALITKINSRLQGVGAIPMRIGSDKSGSKASKYTILGTADGLRPLDTESAYLDAVRYGDVRGDENAAFAGTYKDWNGVGFYRWEQINHANFGSVGSPLLPRAFLGGAISVASPDGVVVKGGGSAAAAGCNARSAILRVFRRGSLRVFAWGNHRRNASSGILHQDHESGWHVCCSEIRFS